MSKWRKDSDCDGLFMVCCGPETTICRGIKSEADADLIADLLNAHKTSAKDEEWFDNDFIDERVDNAREAGRLDARHGTQLVSAGFDDLPFNGCPEKWCEKPFARIAYFHDAGDSSVGEPARSGWTLADDQSGTTVAELARDVKS